MVRWERGVGVGCGWLVLSACGFPWPPIGLPPGSSGGGTPGDVEDDTGAAEVDTGDTEGPPPGFCDAPRSTPPEVVPDCPLDVGVDDVDAALRACVPCEGHPRDLDGDGLPDDWEPLFGASPTTADTDGDGLGDALDVVFADVTLVDADGDGLPDLHEQVYAVPAEDVDGDFDGATDIVEICVGTDPNVDDTDGDGLFDGHEITAGWSPWVAGPGVADLPVGEPVWVALHQDSDHPNYQGPNTVPRRTGVVEDLGFDATLGRHVVASDVPYTRYDADGPFGRPVTALRESTEVFGCQGYVCGPGWSDPRPFTITEAPDGWTAAVAPSYVLDLDVTTLLRRLEPLAPAPSPPPPPVDPCDHPAVGVWELDAFEVDPVFGEILDRPPALLVVRRGPDHLVWARVVDASGRIRRPLPCVDVDDGLRCSLPLDAGPNGPGTTTSLVLRPDGDVADGSFDVRAPSVSHGQDGGLGSTESWDFTAVRFR